MLYTSPDRPTLATLEVVVVPNGEIICLGKTVGWLKKLGRFITVPVHGA